jgi:hypothetical protein
MISYNHVFLSDSKAWFSRFYNKTHPKENEFSPDSGHFKDKDSLFQKEWKQPKRKHNHYGIVIKM